MSTDFKPKNTTIALITNIPAPYRIPIFQHLARNFLNTRFHVIFCAQKEDNRDWIIEQNEFPYCYLKKNYGSWKGRYIHFNLDVINELRKLDADVVITTGFNPTHLLAFIYSLFNQKTHIPMTDGTFESEQTLSALHRIIRRIVYRYSKAFIGASEGSKRLYLSYGIRPEQFFQSHLCANNAAFQSSTSGNRKFDLMFSGRFVTEKNPLFALEVAAGVATILNRKISILLLGSGPLLVQAKDYAVKLSLYVEASFPGFVQQSELPNYYGSAKLLLFPTALDTWGVVANEACAAGQAVMVSPHAGVANELICHRENGYVLPLDHPLWIKHAADLLSDDVLLKQFSNASLQKVKAYNFDAAANGIIDAVLAAKSAE
jgi:glycosyltransferase involved in cell wall biosynthesis